MSRFVCSSTKKGSTLLASSSNDAPQGCKPALGQERGRFFAHRLTAKSATCPFPVAKHCCKWFLLTCRIYVSSLMLLNCACELLPREPKGAREPNASYWMPSKPVLPETFIFLLRAVSRKTASWQPQNSQTRSSFSWLSIKQTASRRDWDTGRQTGDTTPEPASQHPASDRRGWETQGGRHHLYLRCAQLANASRVLGNLGDDILSKITLKSGVGTIVETWPATSSGFAGRLWHLTAEARQSGDTPGASVTRKIGKQTPQPASHHSIWHLTAETLGDIGGQAGDTTPHVTASASRDREAQSPEPASQHLASDRNTGRQAGRHRKQAGDTTRSQRHSIWHLTAETGRQGASGRRHDPAASVTASGI